MRKVRSGAAEPKGNQRYKGCQGGGRASSALWRRSWASGPEEKEDESPTQYQEIHGDVYADRVGSGDSAIDKRISHGPRKRGHRRRKWTRRVIATTRPHRSRRDGGLHG